MNCLRTLLNRLADAAEFWLDPWRAADDLWLHPTPRDGADLLAEREAEEEVAEPERLIGVLDVARANAYSQSMFSYGGQTKEYGPRPRISTPGPRISDSDRLDRIISLLENIQTAITPAAPDIRSSVDAADGPRGTAAQPETRAGHPNPQ